MKSSQPQTGVCNNKYLFMKLSFCVIWLLSGIIILNYHKIIINLSFLQLLGFVMDS